MVFSRYRAVIRCCGLRNNVKTISSSSSSCPSSSGSIFTRFNHNNNANARNNVNVMTMIKNNYSTPTTNTSEKENDVPKPAEGPDESAEVTFLDDERNSMEQDLRLDEYLQELDRNQPGALDECAEDLSHITPEFQAFSYNFAAYANKSPTIQRLAQLGVDFSKIEKRKGLTKILLPLDFEKDMKLHIRFLNDCGVPPDKLGKFLTKNPMIFKIDLDDLYTRIRYLSAHKFDQDMIAEIVCKNPFWVNFSTKRIDTRLGFFQKQFMLNGNEVRSLATKQPRLITYSMEHIKENTFSIREEMGFNKLQTKEILLKKSKIWMKTRRSIVEVFDYVHNEMKLSHEIITQQPEILTFRLNRIKQRHMFLVTQKRAQYDPTQPLYVSLHSMAGGTDAEFCLEVAKTPVETYNLFLKSLYSKMRKK